MSEPSGEPQQAVAATAAAATAEKKSKSSKSSPPAPKSEPSSRHIDPAPLPAATMVGGPSNTNRTAFRGRVSRRGGHASQRTGSIGSSTTTRTPSKRSTPPAHAGANEARTKKKRSSKKLPRVEGSAKSSTAQTSINAKAKAKTSLPGTGAKDNYVPDRWELLQNIILPRQDSCNPHSSFGLSIRPGSGRVLIRSDYVSFPTSKNSAAVLKPCEFPKKGDIVVAVNGQTVFDVHTMDMCSGFSMRPVAQLMRNTEEGKPLQLDLLRLATDNGHPAAVPAAPARSRDEASATKTSVVADPSGRSSPQKGVEVLKEDDADNEDDADDASLWKGADQFLVATSADAKAAITEATTKFDKAVAAESVGGEKDAAAAAAAAAAATAAEHNNFVKVVNGILAQNRREVDLALAKLRDEASRYREATLNRNREATRYRTLIAGASGQDGAVCQRIAVLDKAIEEKRKAKHEYQRLIAAVGDKETMVQVIEERRRQLDAALMQSRAATGTAATGELNTKNS